MRIFIGLAEIAGYYGNLKLGFEELGISTTFVDLEGHPYRYGGDEPSHPLIRLAVFASLKRKSIPRSNVPMKVIWVTLAEFTRTILFIWAAFTHDVFIFVANTSFLYCYDFPMLRRLGKCIICTFHGSDARPPYIDGAVMGDDRGVTVEQGIRLTHKKKRLLEKIDRYADNIISHPYHAHFHERPFLHTTLIGFPYHRPDRQSDSIEGLVRILHSPSHPLSKGTPQIREAIEHLKAGGLALEYVEITGRPNHEVLAELVRCDFVIDQLYSDLLLSGFATEAAFFGKPAIVGGYGLETARRDYPGGNPPPSHVCRPEEIECAIEKLVGDRAYRLQLGEDARRFVRTEWTPAKVAERYLRIIRGDIPAEWVCSPQDVIYLHGYGFPEQRVRKLVGEFIRIGGKAALQLRDKPALERRFMEFSDD
jgi:glycosyltransferase involved in cell wall biosynthesis